MHAPDSSPREPACLRPQTEGPPEAPAKATTLADRRLRSTQLTSRKSISQVVGLSASDRSLQVTNLGAGGCGREITLADLAKSWSFTRFFPEPRVPSLQNRDDNNTPSPPSNTDTHG